MTILVNSGEAYVFGYGNPEPSPVRYWEGATTIPKTLHGEGVHSSEWKR